MSEIKIEGIPETITRQQYVETIRGLGIDPEQLLELRWDHQGIHAVVYALNKDGMRFATGNRPNRRPATHKLFIRVEDEPQVEEGP